MNYKTVLFDLDGTLLNSEPAVLPCAAAIIEEMGYPVPEYNKLKRFIGPPLRMALKEIAGITDEEELNEAERRYRAKFAKESLQKFEFYPHMEELLGELKKSGAKIAIASVRFEESIYDISEFVPLKDYFDVICGRAEAKGIVTKADICELALKRLGVGKENAALVGDSKYDEEGANTVGIDFVAAMYGFGFDSESEAPTAKFYGYDVRELINFFLK